MRIPIDKSKLKGRPITNKVERIAAPPKAIAKAIFRAADKKIRKLGS